MCRTAYSKEHGWYIIKSCKLRNLIVQHPCNINLYSIQFLLPLNSQRIGNELLFSSIHFKMLVIKKNQFLIQQINRLLQSSLMKRNGKMKNK